jgi:hypothetical protein
MKRLVLLVLAVLVPFAGLVAFGLSQLDSGPAPAAPLPPAAPALSGPGEAARERVARALAPPAPTTAPAAAAPGAPTPQVARGPLAPPPPGAAPLMQLPASPLEQEAAAFAARPRPTSALGKDQGTVMMPPPRSRGSPQVMESVMKNGFPPRVEAAARQLTAHCWADSKARAPGQASVTVLARPTPDGRFEQTRVSWSSWQDPIFMACVEDAIHEGMFQPGDPLPPAPVIHTLEFGGAAQGR